MTAGHAQMYSDPILRLVEVNMSSSSGTSFFARWVTAVTLCLVLASSLAFTFMWTVGEAVENSAGEAVGIAVTMALFGALFGGGLGLGQALVLRSTGVPARTWIIQTLAAGAIGMAIGFSIVFVISDIEQLPQIAAAAVVGISLGVPIGLVQVRLLKEHMAQAQLWLPISLVALIASFVVGLPLGGEGRELLSLGAVALMYALISGAGMARLLQTRRAAVA